MRGDCGYGNEVLLGECEARALPCFFKLRHTAKVKTLLAQMQRAPFGCAQGTRGAAWTDAGEGWEVLEARLRLSGWSRERRVVPFDRLRAFGSCARRLRRPPSASQRAAAATPSRPRCPAPRAGAKAPRLARPPASLFPSASSALGRPDRRARHHPRGSRLPRRRARPALSRTRRRRTERSEIAKGRSLCPKGSAGGRWQNICDELKNQWGWCGYTTPQLAPSRLMANQRCPSFA